MSGKGRGLLLHPLLWGLLISLLGVYLIREGATPRTRDKAIGEALERDRVRKADEAAEAAGLSLDQDTETPIPLIMEEIPSAFEDWYLDDDVSQGACPFDYNPERSSVLNLGKRPLSNRVSLLMSAQDLAFLAWTSFTYRINPHFLLGIMVAESGGDCSAVSTAGAQGCFQITYRQGAGQLRNSFAERVADWYWAPRVSGKVSRRPGEALGYFPADLYVPPATYFGMPVKKGTRQLRMTLDPVATLMTSSRSGETLVSSVANYSFGVVGAGLYFHFLNYYLFSHETQLRGDVYELVNALNGKSMWMAASYNMGSPSTMRALGNRGPRGMWKHLSSEVLQYADTVTSFCEQLQGSPEHWEATMTWGQFSDFLQQLRWTYSSVPIDWERLQDELHQRFFRQRQEIQLRSELLPIFRAMRALEPRLAAEKPRLDHKVRF